MIVVGRKINIRITNGKEKRERNISKKLIWKDEIRQQGAKTQHSKRSNPFKFR